MLYDTLLVYFELDIVRSDEKWDLRCKFEVVLFCCHPGFGYRYKHLDNHNVQIHYSNLEPYFMSHDGANS